MAPAKKTENVADKPTSAAEPPRPLRYLLVNESRLISMIHSRQVRYAPDVPYYTASQGVGPIDRNIKLYLCGGPVIKVFYQDYFDTMICWGEACTYCSDEEIPWIEGMQRKYDAADAAEKDENIAIEVSPYKGLPFVHSGRDTVPEDEHVRCFKPKSWPGDVPERTTTADVVFDNRNRQPMEEGNGQRGLCKVLICEEGECAVCDPANG